MLYDPKWKGPNRPSAYRTDLTSEEITALHRVKSALISGEIESSQFCMAIYSDTSCGTRGCIAGWMAIHSMREDMNTTHMNQLLEMGKNDRGISNMEPHIRKYFNHYYDPKFGNLFYPMMDYSVRSSKIFTVKNGITAITRFLRGYDHPWGTSRRKVAASVDNEVFA